MKQTITFLCAMLIFLCPGRLHSQSLTTITTGLPNAPSSLGATAATITFTITNNNSYGVILKSLDFYRASNQNGMTFNLRYSSTSLSGQTSPVVSTWSIIATTTSGSVSTTAIHPLFTNLNFTIPGNTTYRFAVQHSGGSLNYGGATTTPNSYTNGGVVLGRGDYQINGQNVGYSGSSGSTLAFNPRFWCGTITFEPAIANDLSAVSLLSPTPNGQLCYSSSKEVKTIIKNNGSAAQSNFSVGAYYSGPIGGNLSTTYTGTLAPGASDTVTIGNVNFQPGNYSMRAYTLLVADSLSANDSTSNASFTIKPPVGAPMAFSDTVCAGDSALVYVDAQPGTIYNWYSAQSGGTLLNATPTVSFSPLLQDTSMYVSALIAGCESGRVLVSAAIGQPPTLDLGLDTSFCETVPLVLDGGNAGGKYIWSTGDTTQIISITNVSGTYWVEVDKYCLTSDTIEVTVAPVPTAAGISYVRMDNKYHFTASQADYVTDYIWIFGDGSTEAGIAPPPPQPISAVHQYAWGLNEAMNVKLVVNNNCGTDTVARNVPTGLEDLLATEDGIKVYPNPASDKLHIYADNKRIEEVQLFDLKGKLLISQLVAGKTGVLDINTLSNGMYLLRLRTAEGSISKPVQVLR